MTSGSARGGGPGHADYSEEVDVRTSSRSGRRVVEKLGTGRSRNRLRREAAALAQLQGHGVVELVELREEESSTLLVTTYVGARTLADAHRLQPHEILRALHGTAKVVLELHNRGWAHRALRSEHVLIGPRARVKLCSLGDAAPLSDEGARTDLRGIVAMVAEIAAMPVTGESFAERRAWRRMRAHLYDTLRTLDSEGRTASGTEPGSGLREFLNAFEPDPPVRRSDLPPVRPLARTVAASAAFVVALVAAICWSGVRGGSSRAAETHENRGGIHPTLERVDRPPDDPGNLVAVDGKIFRIGLEDDRVAVGDWNCDGKKNALLLRPSTGEVFMFDEWASAGTPTSARRIGVVNDATDLLTPSDGCGTAVLRLEDGSDRRLRTDAP